MRDGGILRPLTADMNEPALLALEDGSVFSGISIGHSGTALGEVVFNTAMTGYQEILTDPSYAKQIVTLTCPHIGNTGINKEDMEAKRIWMSGLVIRSLSQTMSNYRSEIALQTFLKQEKLVAAAEIDTRQLASLVRSKGAMSAVLLAGQSALENSKSEAVALAKSFPGLNHLDLTKTVTTEQAYEWHQGSWRHGSGFYQPETSKFHVVAYDFGIKRNILRLLADKGCHIQVVPAATTAEEALQLKPDGIFLSNGPGDPEPCTEAIAATRTFLARGTPLFGICLGHQILALACRATTEKMKYGHHGANHPVHDLVENRVIITSQNHGFTVSREQLPACLEVTHVSLFDGSIQGISHKERPAFGFQGHPEASPGPHEANTLFDRFIKAMEVFKTSKGALSCQNAQT